MKRVLGSGLVLSLALAVSGCVHGDFGDGARATVSETRALPPDGRFTLENVNGRVEIQGWDEAKVSIEATKRARNEKALDEIHVRIDDDDDQVRVRVRNERPFFFGSNGRVDFVVKVPRTARVKVDNTNGRVEVAGMTAPVEAATVNGSVKVNDVTGSVRASTVNGSIEASLSRLDPGAESRLKTTNGSVQLTLPREANAEIDASTVNGGVTCDFDLDGERKTKRKLAGRIGAGGARFDISTVNGTVNIDRGASDRADARPTAEATPQAESR